MKCTSCGFPLTKDDIEVYVNEKESLSNWNQVSVQVVCPNCGHKERIH